jgi:hypothetical protein
MSLTVPDKDRSIGSVTQIACLTGGARPRRSPRALCTLALCEESNSLHVTKSAGATDTAALWFARSGVHCPELALGAFFVSPLATAAIRDPETDSFAPVSDSIATGVAPTGIPRSEIARSKTMLSHDRRMSGSGVGTVKAGSMISTRLRTWLVQSRASRKLMARDSLV